MADKVLTEILAAHADALSQKRVNRDMYLRQVSNSKQHEELESLLRLTEQLERTLVPVQPSPAFVKNLIRQLVVTSDKELARPARGYRRWMFIGAAAVGSLLSVVGIVAYLLRNRMQVKTQITSAG